MNIMGEFFNVHLQWRIVVLEVIYLKPGYISPILPFLYTAPNLRDDSETFQEKITYYFLSLAQLIRILFEPIFWLLNRTLEK